MRRMLLDEGLGTGAVLAMLAACALLTSAILFLRIHHGPTSRDIARGHILPGLTLVAAGPDLVVTSIESGGEAARRGVAVGDEVTAIDGKAFHSLDQAEAYLVKTPHSAIMLELREAGQTRLVTLNRAEE